MTTATKPGKLVVLDPTSEAVKRQAAMARRVPDLSGKTVGLLANAKHNSQEILEEVYALLAERYELAGAVRAKKKDGSSPAPPKILDELAAQCQVVITAIGD